MVTYRADEAWTALGDPSRRAIVECLAERPRAVGELADDLPISRPAVSQHLRVLKDAGFVAERREGTSRIYRADKAALGPLRSAVEDHWRRGLGRVKDLAEAEQRAKDRS